MPIARLPSDQEAIADGFHDAACQRRREVLRETLTAFETCAFPDHLHERARLNLSRWRQDSRVSSPQLSVLVLPGDWGQVTLGLTKRFGECFAVLNMANAYFPGGAYGEGAVAQEENMFRRTDCHYQVKSHELNEDGRTYTPEVSRLLCGVDGTVYLDVTTPRVCIRGPEDRTAPDLGYAWLPPGDIFPFYELRASAQDLRDGSAFDAAEARHRIAAQLDTLCDGGIKHAVLGAFGCGAFGNPASIVARVYQEEIAKRREAFSILAFAIFSAGYGPDNFAAFKAVFADAA